MKRSRGNSSAPADVDELAEDLEKRLMREFGPILSGEALRNSLGYRSAETFRQAVAKGTVPIPVFNLESRRGKYGLAKDVARWLAEMRVSSGESDRRR